VITPDGCVVVPAGAGRAVRGAAGAATVMKVDGLETSDLLSAFEQVAPAGSGPPLHIHHDCAETLYVLTGEFRFEIGSELATAPASTFIFIPKGVPHTYTNVGTADGRILFWFNPAARMAGYFEELAQFRSERPTDQKLDDIASRHGVEIVRGSSGG
jgi:mannose-6-phosphate isomerase-like protein (cupin superfamily)